MTFTKDDLPFFVEGHKVAYRYTSECVNGDIGEIVKAEMYSNDDFEFNGILLTIADSSGRLIRRDA